MDYIIEGPKGTGKTFGATALVLRLLEMALKYLKRRGRGVAVNWDVVPPKWAKLVDLRKPKNLPKNPEGAKERYEREGICPTLYRFDDWSQLLKLEDVDIVSDEAQSAAGARDWEKMPKYVRNWLSHLRHFGVNLIALTQHYKFVDIYLRRLIGSRGVWSSWRIFNLTVWVHRSGADPETGEMKMPGIMDLLDFRLFVRPFRDLDAPSPICDFRSLLEWSRKVPEHYMTRDRATFDEVTPGKKTKH